MRQGQISTLIGTLMMFIMVMIFAYFIFFAYYTNDNFVQKSAGKQVDYEIGDQRKRAVIDTTLEDKVWKAPGNPKSHYENITGYDLISYYMSTPDDQSHIYLDGNSIHEDEAKSNLTNYLGYKMNMSWLDWRGEEIDYYLSVSKEDYDRKVEVSVNNYYPSARWSRTTIPMGIAGGERIELKLWTRTSNSIYGVYR